MTPRTCKYCELPLPPARASYPWSLYCCDNCARSASKKRGSVSAYPGLSTASVGALHELLVCADLLKRGFHVFRAVSPSCSCDLAILDGSRLLRIEVTTGYKSASGSLSFPEHSPQNYDVLAVVSAGEISYFPPFSHPSPILPDSS